MNEIMFYHIDKSGQVVNQFIDNNGNKILLIGDLNRNAFPEGFIQNRLSIINNGKIDQELVDRIVSYFESSSIGAADTIINDLVSNPHIKNDLFLSRVLREIIFESVRIEKFKNRPSRLRCIYLIDNESLINNWFEYLGTSPTNSTCYTFRPTSNKRFEFTNGAVIEESIHKADAKFLEVDIDNVKLVKEYADNYWSGKETDTPMFEVLFYGGLIKMTTKSNTP